ncbi:hypothetical protein DM860_015801 [Cuscuta australis]|uniref:Heat stress transcription factor n=1 Tax=Cuscuta australis TaxID=267555 RepID=A0A328DY35_9ASTE|nr:hypothetical protein DM860_015801 [Cuscuta australis]
MELRSRSSGNGAGGNGAPPPHPPQPAPMPSANSPPPFLVKTYDMVEDPSTDKIVSWSATNNSFVVWDPPEFGRNLLPKYFKHSNFSSFVRQLNTYGFRKVDPDRWEFANEGFLRGQKHLLKNISRRKPAHGQNHPQQQPQGQTSSSVGACVEVGKFGYEEEVEMLKRDKNVLMQEIFRLRQHQQSTDNEMQTMAQRLQAMEQRQQQIMSFLAKAVNSPGFLAHFVQQQNDISNRRITEGNKKRRLKQDVGESDEQSVSAADGQIVRYQPMMNDTATTMLRQMMKKLDSPPPPPRLDSSVMGDDVSSQSNTLDHDSPPNCVSLTAISEVHSSPPLNTADMGNEPFSDTSPAVGAQDMLPASDMMIPELYRIPEVVGSQSNMGITPTSLEENGKMDLQIDGFSPDPQIEWQNALLDEDLPLDTSFWEKFLLSPPGADAEQMDLIASEDPQDDETTTDENRWENMEQLTEQMGQLSSTNTNGQPSPNECT